jgi:WD40 repeat protein
LSVIILGSGLYLVCGGEDERIKIFNLKENKALGDISNTAHSGSLTCMEFFQDSYLITGSEVFFYFLFVFALKKLKVEIKRTIF